MEDGFDLIKFKAMNANLEEKENISLLVLRNRIIKKITCGSDHVLALVYGCYCYNPN